uniref:Uncharacterized protein n=1 Tax=Candidatus Kentrum sp. TC TaxID=2126339 RepID=A0A450Z4E1_9GAMM|nr:MAG: hypothetical protein BECKTC1821E_GA0114239_11245 [Candidatus Kentron sp. TC]
MTESELSELLGRLREIERYFDSGDFDKWFEEQNDEDKETCLALISKIGIRKGELENYELQILADRLDQLASSLDEGITELEREIEEMRHFTRMMETLGRVIELLSRAVTLVV